MRSLIVFRIVLLCGVSLPQLLFCQNTASSDLAVDARKNRHLLTPNAAQQALSVYNLIPGKNYALLLPIDENGQNCRPTIVLLELGATQVDFDPTVHQLSFRAIAPTMHFRLDYPCTWADNHPPTHFLTLRCTDCEPLVVKKDQPDVVALQVAKGQSAESLVKDVLIGGTCFDVQNVTFTGKPGQIGTFSNGTTNIGLRNGIIMATGDIDATVGINDQDNASLGYGIFTPDSNLSTLTTGAIFDRANLEFDFTPTETPVTFDFVFASEEYCEYVNSPFNDVFGFFISGPGITGNGNIALVPATNTPVAINNVNHLLNTAYFINNTGPGGTLCGQTPAVSPAVGEIQYDGFTRKLTATANVVPCQKYHIRLKIADVEDGLFDSAVFLRAGSFDAGGDASVMFAVNGDPTKNEVHEGCGTAQLIFHRLESDLSTSLMVSYTVSGTATSGVDYVPISNSVTIAPGQSTVTIPITILNDALLEGQETLIITLTSACSCTKPQEILYISDLPNLNLVADTVSICGPGIGNVAVHPLGGVAPFIYQWSVAGNIAANLSILTPVSTNYQVTVTDVCGKSNVATARVNVNTLPAAQLLPSAPQLCPGQEGQLLVNFTGQAPFTLQYSLNSIPQPAVTGIVNNPYTLIINALGQYQINGVSDAMGCAGPGQGSILVIPATLAASGIVTNAKCSGQATGAINVNVLGGQAPFTYAWTGPQTVPPVANPGNLAAGQYTVTITDALGCKQTQAFVVNQPPALNPLIVSTTGSNCYNANGGSINLNVIGGTPVYIYQWSNGTTGQDPQNLAANTYTVTVTDQAMCTKTAVATVTGNFTAPLVNAAAMDSLSCVVHTLQLSSSGSSTGLGYNYSWTANPGHFTGGGPISAPVIDQAGTYNLVVTSTANGCTAADSVQVVSTVAYPVADAGPAQTLTCTLQQATLTGTTAATNTYSWTASQGGTIISGATSLQPTISTPGLYMLAVTDTHNGCVTIDSTLVDSDLTSPNSVIQAPGLLTCLHTSAMLDASTSTPASGVSYQWLTVDGNIQSGQFSAQAVVTEPGAYTLIVTNTANGCPDSSVVMVQQDQSVPVVDAGAYELLSCITEEVTIEADSSSAGSNFTLLWTSSTGTGFVSGENTLHPTVNEPGIYTLLITNTTNQCTASATVLLGQDLQAPTIDAGLPGTLTCDLATLTIGDINTPVSPDFDYQWTTANGHIDGGANASVATINAPGTYTLVITDFFNGCTSTDSVVIDQNISNPIAVTGSGGQLNCTTPVIQLNGNGSSTGPAYSYNWTSNTGGGLAAGAHTLTPTVTAAGIYTLVVRNTANGCTASAVSTVTTSADLPVAVAAPLDTFTCATQQIDLSALGSSAGPGYSYQWGTVNGQILGGQNMPQVTVGASGQYTLIVTNLTNQCAASFTVNTPADLNAPLAEAGVTQTLACTLPSLQLNGAGSSVGGQFQYLWNGPGLISGTATLLPTINQSGDYHITVTNVQNGCTSTDQVSVLADINDPVVQIAAPGTLTCTNTAVELQGAGSSNGANFSYQWTGPGITSDDTEISIQVNTPGDYILVITNALNGCTSIDTVPVTQNILIPPANAGPDTIMNCFHPQLQIGSATGTAYTFSWSGPGIISGESTAQPVINQGGLYNLTVTGIGNGCSATDQMLVNSDFVQPQAEAGPTAELSCTQTTVLLQATGSAGANFAYAWTTSTGSFIGSPDSLNPVVNGAGDYFLTVTNTTNGCTSTSNVQITQDPNAPHAVISTPGIFTCTTSTLTLNGANSSVGAPFVQIWTTLDGHLAGDSTTLQQVIDEPGTYFLAVTDTTNNCVANSSVVVGADLAPPVADGGPSPTLTCSDRSLSLQGTVSSNGNFIYLWSAQNGGHIISGSNTLNPLVDAAGTYILIVTNQQNGCIDTVSVAALIDQAAPVSTIVQPDTLTCNLPAVLLEASSSSPGNLSYSWSTTNGHFVEPPLGLPATVDQSGLYTLLINNLDNGCTSTASITVNQDIAPPVANAGSNGVLTCQHTALTLDGNGSSQNGNYFYVWETPDGQILANPNSLQPVIIAGGTYNLVVINEHNGCIATDAILVMVDTLRPVVAITTPGALTCTQQQVTLHGNASPGGPHTTYAWLTNDGHISDGQFSAQATVDATGSYTLAVLDTLNGCSSAANTVVVSNIVLPLADAGSPFTLTCTLSEATLQGSGSSGLAYTYAWSTTMAGGHLVSGANTANPVVNQPGLYTLVVTNQQTGCTQTDLVIVDREGNVPTDFRVRLSDPSCQNNDGTITIDTILGGIGPYLYSIDGGQHYFSELGFENVAPGSYDIFIQDANGCEFDQTLVVPAVPTVGISVLPEIQLELSESVQLNATLPPGFPAALIDTVIWTPLEGLTFEGTDLFHLLRPKAQPFKTTEYTVTVISKGNCPASDRVLINVDSDPHIYIPNAFSPWKLDNHNDVFLIFAKGDQIVQVNKFQVFDRWGEMVFTDQNFQPNDPAHGWNGYHKGHLLVPAVFGYYAVIELIDGRKLLYKGDVTLVR